MSETLRIQHLKAIATMNDLNQTDLTVRVESIAPGQLTKDMSVICTGKNFANMLETELRSLEGTPDLSTSQEQLTSVRFYSTGETCPNNSPS